MRQKEESYSGRADVSPHALGSSEAASAPGQRPERGAQAYDCGGDVEQWWYRPDVPAALQGSARGM